MNLEKVKVNLDAIYMQLALVLDPMDSDNREILKSIAEKIAVIKNEIE
jgi:hypothetical protein